MAPVEELRARERLYAPARVSLRVPGESSLLGQEFWRRLRDSGPGPDVKTVFLAPVYERSTP
jgi:hypothetical protein